MSFFSKSSRMSFMMSTRSYLSWESESCGILSKMNDVWLSFTEHGPNQKLVLSLQNVRKIRCSSVHACPVCVVWYSGYPQYRVEDSRRISREFNLYLADGCCFMYKRESQPFQPT